MSLLEQVYEVSMPRESKADIVDYYQREYPGQGAKGWKQTLIRDLLERNYDVTVGTVGKEEYRRQAKNMAKRFDPQRLNNPELRNAKEYETLGATLPPMPPEGGYHIFGTIWCKYSDDDTCNEREMDEYITGEAAEELANMSAAEMVQAALNAYQSQDGDIDFNGPSLSDCADPELTVEPIE